MIKITERIRPPHTEFLSRIDSKSNLFINQISKARHEIDFKQTVGTIGTTSSKWAQK